MKKLNPIVLACLAVMLFVVPAAPASADVIEDPYWPVIVQPADPPAVPGDTEPEEVPDETEPPPAAETEEAPETEEKKSGKLGYVAPEAQSLSAPVTALAAGILAIAVGMLVHSIIRNRREDRFEKEHLHR